MSRQIHLLLAVVLVLTLLPIGTPASRVTATTHAQTTATPLTTSWLSVENGNSLSAAWGDVDNDGDLDLAVGTAAESTQLLTIDLGANRLYLNCTVQKLQKEDRNDNCPDEATGLTPAAVWLSGEADNTTSVAWGDVDNDGDLDLAVGNSSEPNRLYRNCTIPNDGCNRRSTWLETTAFWSSSERNDDTSSVAWGDYDGDGDLDLAVGNSSKPNRLYRNCTIPNSGCAQGATGLEATAFWSSDDVDDTTSIAWGDYDNDGDLDLAVGNRNQANRIYRNDNGRLSSVWSSSERDDTSSVAWGDYDGDGDLDLAAGNRNQANRIYRNNNGRLTSAWSSPERDDTTSVAWGDYDNDGDLDLAVGNGAEVVDLQLTRGENRIYRNDNGALSLGWSSPEREATSSVTWADVDSDGDLDLAVSNKYFDALGQLNRIYRNDGVLIPPQGNDLPNNEATREKPQVPTAGYANSLIWGDADNDGDLDLAAGRSEYDYGLENFLYENCATTRNGSLCNGSEDAFLTTGSWLSDEADSTTHIAWGDVDNDGDLDLAVANGFPGAWNTGPIRIYRNCTVRTAGDGCTGNNRGIAAEAFWSSDEEETFKSVAWGDVDGDGDLDIAAGGQEIPTRLYRNCTIRQTDDGCDANNTTSGMTPNPIWLASESEIADTWSIAWGDVDGDGDLDLAVGNYSGTNRIYGNKGGTLTSTAIWASNENDDTFFIAWGDVDGDADLDLAVGNNGQRNRLYRNNNGTLSKSTVWSSAENDETRSIAWGDADSDGDLDLAVANSYAGSQQNRLYRNDNGVLSTSAVWTSATSDASISVAWGDADNDGDLDLAFGNWTSPNKLFTNTRNTGALNAPAVFVGMPQTAQPIPAASAYALGTVLSGPSLTFNYTLTHPYSQPAARIRVQYSLDGGGSWHNTVPAVISDTEQLISSPDGTSHTFVWDIAASGIYGQSDQAMLRLIADAGDSEISAELSPNSLPSAGIPGPFLYSGAAAVTAPFRLRGTVARVTDSDGNPIAGAQVYRIPAGQSRGGAPLRSHLNGMPILSNADGYVPSREPLLPDDRLIALRVMNETSKYTIYHTSGVDLINGVPRFVVKNAGEQVLAVSDQDPLLALNLSVSLEWDARNDSGFMVQLRRDLARTAELLYDWTDGQVTLGRLTIHHNKQNWAWSDIQIFATNRLRPNATQGGIVSKITPDPDRETISYEPGQVRMPVTWSRNAVPGETFGEDWPRTLAHELGHYALYLDDNYLGLDDQNNLITVGGCSGVMSNPYSDRNSEFQPDGIDWQPGGACEQTLSARSTGRSDWATITDFYRDLRAPATFNQHPGPNRIAFELLNISESADMPKTPPTARELTLNLITADQSNLYQPSAMARALLYTDVTTQAIDLGTPIDDLLLVRGANNGDTVCVYDTFQDLVGCDVLNESSKQLELRSLPNWRPALRITPETSRTLRLEVSWPANIPNPPRSLSAQIFPSEGEAATLDLQLQAGNTGASYTATLTLPKPAVGGLVRLWNPAAPQVQEAVADYNLGGDPAPPRKPKKRKRRAPALSADGQALLLTDNLNFQPGQFYAFQAIDRLPEPPPWATPIGLGYRLLASDPQLRAQIPTSTTLSLSYFSSDVPLGAENGVQIYFYPNDGNTWERLDTILSVEETTAGARPRGEGIYALMASVPLQIQPEWNLIFFYPGSDQSLPQAMAAAPDNYRMIYAYDPANPDDPWKVHVAGLPEPWAELVNDLEGVQNGAGYWLWGNNTEAITVTLLPHQGLLRQIRRSPILNAPPATYYGIVPVNSGNAGLRVTAFVGDGSTAKRCGSTTTQSITIDGVSQQAFSLNVLANGSAAALGCGAPDAPVRIEVAAGNRVVGNFTTTWNNTAPIALNAAQFITR